MAHRDRQIASVAARQHGVALLAQLVAAGVTRRAVARRVEVGSPPPSSSRRVCGGAHSPEQGGKVDGSCACVWGRRDTQPPQRRGAVGPVARIEAAPSTSRCPGAGGRRRRRGICLHRSLLLTPAVTSHSQGHPSHHPRPHAGRPALRVATPRRAPAGDPPGRSPGIRDRRGSRADRTRSELERLFLRLCRRHRIPPPEVNARIGPFLVDFLWRDRRADRRDRWLSLPPRSLGFRSRPRP